MAKMLFDPPNPLVLDMATKGQVTIPVEIRKALAIETGDRLEFISSEGGKVVIVAATKSIADLKGRFAKPDRALTIEEINAAIADQAARSR